MFWERFYNLCKENGTSPSAVTKAIGISHAATTKWKNGTNPNGDVLAKLSGYFDVSIDYLMGLTDDKAKTLPTISIDDLDNLPEDVQGKLSFRISGTEEEIKRVEDYLRENGILHYEGEKKQATPDEQPVSDVEQELLALTADMDEDERNAVLGYAARILAKRKKED